MTTEHGPGARSPFGLGIRGLCPRCHQGRIFAGFLRLAERCDVCGLDLSFADPADGPAFFTMSIVSFPVVALAAWMEISLGVPLWINLAVTLTLMFGSCCALLRPLKGWLVCSQYINKAQEGRLAAPDEEAGDRPRQ
ncbi:DUF983 domain-containing protein [Arenibaculum sp.]|uniref:DUF983 domain-containing protein n=1 Tax=Arenibaculum sp. TaxID=2865862 RepID=UPI002E13E105|nr:DUF983 domain-containing protein [Arenibaculum sp.]